MKILKKNLLVIAFCILSVFSFVFGFAFSTKENTATAASVSAEENFYIYGASVRAPEGEIGAAVKFHVLAKEDFYEENVADNTVNVKIILAKNLSEGETVLTTQNTSKVKTFTITSSWSVSSLADGYLEAVAYFYGIPDTHYDADLAVAAEIVENGESTYHTNQQSASLAWVAWKSGSSDFDEYRPDYTVSFDNGTEVTAKYGTSFGELNVADATKTGYAFDGWDCDAEQAITSNVSVNAKWSVDYTLSLENTTATIYNDTTNGAGIFDLDATHAIAPQLSVEPAEEVVYSYESNNDAVATVVDGVVTATGKGVATITVTATDSFTTESQSKDVEITVKNYYEIADETAFDAIVDDADGYYRMIGDIAFTGTHKNTIEFTGTFDGNGKKITGLVTAQRVGSGDSMGGGGLFFRMKDATIQNVIVENATVAYDSSVFAGATYGTMNEIKNVYVSVRTVTNGTNGSGVFVNRTFYPLTISNAVAYVYAPDATIGFVKAKAGEDDSTVKDCVFIGTGVDYRYAGDTGEIKTENTVICSAIEAHNEANLSMMSEQNKTAFEANHKLLNNDNFKATLHTATTEVLELTEKIDLENVLWHGHTPVQRNAIFSGVFEGNGFEIINMNMGYTNGLFWRIDGAIIRNVKILDVTMGRAKSGVLADGAQNTRSTISNVYISVSSWYDDVNYQGAVVGFIDDYTIGFEIDNSVICVSSTSSFTKTPKVGILSGGGYQQKIKVSNCVFITEDGTVSLRGITETGNNYECEDDSLTVYNQEKGEVAEAVLVKMGALRATYEANFAS